MTGQLTIASDLEGTLSAGEMWKAIGTHLKASPQRAAYQRMFVGRMPGFVAMKAGLIDSQGFKNDWFVRLARFFAGWDRARLGALCDEVVDQHLWPQRRQPLVDELRAAAHDGAQLVIVSGGFEPIVDVFAERLKSAGIAGVVTIATPLVEQGGLFTGALADAVCTGEQKVRRLRALLNGRPLDRAYGDTYSDIPMLSFAASGVAVCPDKRLATAAAQHGWRVLRA
jgi:HAD superfamily phosphoserine phosphatase-like hydrolase